MAEPHSDEHLAQVLASVGDHLVVPEVGPWSPASRGRRPGGRRVVGAAAAALLGVAVAGGLGITPVREAVADWFGFGSTGFERVAPDEADPTGLPPIDAGLPAVSRTDAEAVLGRPLLIAASRKAFLGRLLADEETGEPRPAVRRDDASAAVSALAAANGAWCVRAHAVAPSADAVRVARRWGAV